MRFAALSALALPLLAVATAIPRDDNSCSTGTVNCCQSVQASSSSAVTSILSGLLGPLIALVLGPITGNVGLTCSPILGVLSSTSCSSQAACCNGNSFGGLITLACSPINIVL